MRPKGKYRIPELATALRLTALDLRRTLRHRRCPLNSPRGGQFVWLSDLQKYTPEIVETLRVLESEA